MKYRIVEKMGKFYPQYSKGWIWWNVYSWQKGRRRECPFVFTLEKANEILNEKFQLNQLKKKGTIIHAPQLSNQHSE